jgi:cobalt-zinc-cadmium efflux system membrane fusion protein
MKSKTAWFTAISLVIGILLLFQAACRNKSGSPAAREEAEPNHEARETQGERSQAVVQFTDDQIREFGIETGPAAPGILRMEAVLPGEVMLNADRVAHVVSRVSGVVREVRKNLGDSVRRGEVMAVLESRELADSMAALLAAHERVVLAKSNFAREEQAWRKKISPEQDYIEAQNKLAEANIELHTAEQKMRALGFSNEYIAQLPGRRDADTILYRIAAPFDGTVIEKHINIGEVLKDDITAFLIADFNSVWVNLDVQQKDLALIKVGQPVTIDIGDKMAGITGRVSFLDPIATTTNRTIHARVVVPNVGGRLRPGLFITGRVLTGSIRASVLVPNDALVMIDGRMYIFKREGSGYRPEPVIVGRTDGHHTEISQGLNPGQLYAIKGAFTLKSDMEKAESE